MSMTSITLVSPPFLEYVYERGLSSLVFMSPLPNPKLWNQPTIGKLQSQECFGSGGWWHDERILAATGEGLEKEEPKAWEGWWNEQVVGEPNLC